MNGKQARRLRKVAAALKLDPNTGYAFAGPTRDANGRPVRRPIVMGPCRRRAQQEAKKLYLGYVHSPEGMLTPAELDAIRKSTVAPFHERHVDSMKIQEEGPVEK